jgi:hypothetical protein
MPPHVSYELTPMGRTLLEATDPLIAWSHHHLPDIDAARERYDARTTATAGTPASRNTRAAPSDTPRL